MKLSHRLNSNPLFRSSRRKNSFTEKFCRLYSTTPLFDDLSKKNATMPYAGHASVIQNFWLGKILETLKF